MTVRIRVTERGLTEARAEIDTVASRLEDLTPAAWMIRARWHESQRRTFSAGRWKSRSASTRSRYRRANIGTGMGSARRYVSGARGGVLVLSGRLREGTTRPHAPGQLDRVRRTGGGLTFTGGVQTNGPLGYAATLAKRGRDPIEIDIQAVGDATNDITDYLIAGRVRARR